MQTLFIGAGAMGGAILSRSLQAKKLLPENTYVTVKSEEHAYTLLEDFGVNASTQLPDLSTITTIILAVKPQVMKCVLDQLKDVPEGTIIISLAAGITLSTLSAAVPQAIWFHAMPNTPAAVGVGMTALTAYGEQAKPYTKQVVKLFDVVGVVSIVEESHLDCLSALSGAGPGYMFVIMDALADAGVRMGLPRDLAIKAAAQTMYGAGKMAVESGEHPAVLRDQVTSPGGTTIAGIAAMEKGGLRSALHDGVLACLARSNELGK